MDHLHNALKDESHLDEEKLSQQKSLYDKVVFVLQSIHDPEISINIWDLGLIYKIDIETEGIARIDMTLTAPACPVAGAMPEEVKRRLQKFLPTLGDVSVHLVWDPPWSKDMMSEVARLHLDLW